MGIGCYVEMQQAQQQQIEHQNQLRIQQEEEKMRLDTNSRPEEHFLTIALNGTYLYYIVVVWGYSCRGTTWLRGEIGES